jgi:hypothetical protein
MQSDVDDVHMFGVIATLFDNDSTSAVFNWAHAWDITDGFTGLTVMPFIATENPGRYLSPSNRTPAATSPAFSPAPRSAIGMPPHCCCGPI